MNDLFSGDKFFGDMESVKDELKELERLRQNLQSSHEHSKTLDNAKAVKDLRSRMEADVTFALKKAKVLKVRLKALDRSNAANRSLPCCGPGSSSDRTRISVVNGLRKKLKDSMDSFNSLRQKMLLGVLLYRSISLCSTNQYDRSLVRANSHAGAPRRCLQLMCLCLTAHRLCWRQGAPAAKAWWR
ncbi:hypothetical protein PRUPE_7G197300 [Prunus persica]|uniref:Syntaxin N-terminal domain-containing protein n=1 Tax=Prunus persica TaxID=3760 RepID=A0A251NG06_PRUPE|nr:syntaxin-121-like [Prunus persica]ONH97569.1 hypothetical protein PRUPE_7G197300 [Prunus persica]